MSCLDGTTDSMDLRLSKLWEMVKDREAWYAAVGVFTKSDTTVGPSNNKVHTVLFLIILC